MSRIAVLGFAHGHVMMFGGVWRDNPDIGVTLAAAWDNDAARLDAGADRLHIEGRYSDIDELLSRKDIDAVVITSETLYHAELAVKAAKAGKDIIMYKPMALTLSQADEIVEAVNQNNVRFTMGWQMRGDPQNIKMKQMIHSGELGRLFMLRRRHCLSTHIWKGFADTWHASPELNRDIWADDASHPVDFIHWLLGMPATVSAEFSSMHDERIPNDNGVALFKYADGTIAEITCSFVCSAAESTTELYFEKGTMLQYYGDAVSTSLPRPTGQCGLKWYYNGDAVWTDSNIPSPGTHSERIAWQARPMAEFLRGGAPIANAEQGRDSLKLILATYLSNSLGQRVPVDDKRLYDI